jgi:hypothetical protein
MGYETANLHLATYDQRRNVLRDLAKRKKDWLLETATAMAKATKQDWEDWRAGNRDR